jgi:hypothetical protein
MCWCRAKAVINSKIQYFTRGTNLAAARTPTSRARLASIGFASLRIATSNTHHAIHVVVVSPMPEDIHRYPYGPRYYCATGAQFSNIQVQVVEFPSRGSSIVRLYPAGTLHPRYSAVCSRLGEGLFLKGRTSASWQTCRHTRRRVEPGDSSRMPGTRWQTAINLRADPVSGQRT